MSDLGGVSMSDWCWVDMSDQGGWWACLIGVGETLCRSDGGRAYL